MFITPSKPSYSPQVVVKLMTVHRLYRAPLIPSFTCRFELMLAKDVGIAEILA